MIYQYTWIFFGISLTKIITFNSTTTNWNCTKITMKKSINEMNCYQILHSISANWKLVCQFNKIFTTYKNLWTSKNENIYFVATLTFHTVAIKQSNKWNFYFVKEHIWLITNNSFQLFRFVWELQILKNDYLSKSLRVSKMKSFIMLPYSHSLHVYDCQILVELKKFV